MGMNYKNDQDAIVTCNHCGSWCAVYTQCLKCGAPVEPKNPDENHSPMIACNYCMCFGVNRTECQHCGAPMPERLVYYEEDENVESSYWGSSGHSLREDVAPWC